MDASERRCLLLAVLMIVLFFASLIPALAHDEDHNNDAWYGSLMQPDNPSVSCCGLADAYWADEVFVRDGKTYVRITDDRADAPLGRPHIPVGTEVYVPNHKLKWDAGNPTGHAVIFMRGVDTVFCFVQGGGV